MLVDKLKEKFYFSQWEYSERKICIVKITTDSGHVGWGEGYGVADVIKAGIDYLSHLIIDKDPLDVETLWQLMYRKTLDYARRGVLVASISAIDIALWDLKGKILEQPIYVLLGGKKRDSIIPYATGLYFKEDQNLIQSLCNEAKGYTQLGYKAIKMKVGLGVQQDLEHIAAVREAIGTEIHLMIDANHAYNLREATELARAVEKFNIFWFEEPLSPEYYDQYKELRTNTVIPISGGECEYMRYGFQQLFSSKSVDIAQPDICSTGGLTEAKKIATLASVYGIEIVPHTWGTGIAFAAATHFIANLDVPPGRLREAVCFIEKDCTENGLREALTSSNSEIMNGVLNIDNSPGLGITVNEDVIKEYQSK